MTMTISGDGTIGGLVAGGLPNATVVQADLAANVAGTGPAFSAYQSAPQSVSNGTFTRVVFEIEEFDTASCYNNTGSTVGGIPAYAFLPNVAGYYLVTVSAALASIGSYYETVAVYKNGADYKHGSVVVATAGSYPQATGTVLVYLNGTTDYVQGYISHGQGTTQNTATGAISTYFQANLVKAA